MPLKLKKRWWIIISVLFIFIILNPTYSDFKDFTGRDENEQLKKMMNFGVFSIYSVGDEEYIAFLKNFIRIPSPPLPQKIVKPPFDPSKPYQILNRKKSDSNKVIP